MMDFVFIGSANTFCKWKNWNSKKLNKLLKFPKWVAVPGFEHIFVRLLLTYTLDHYTMYEWEADGIPKRTLALAMDELGSSPASHCWLTE